MSAKQNVAITVAVLLTDIDIVVDSLNESKKRLIHQNSRLIGADNEEDIMQILLETSRNIAEMTHLYQSAEARNIISFQTLRDAVKKM
jgi:hypothetical protein